MLSSMPEACYVILNTITVWEESISIREIPMRRLEDELVIPNATDNWWDPNSKFIVKTGFILFCFSILDESRHSGTIFGWRMSWYCTACQVVSWGILYVWDKHPGDGKVEWGRNYHIKVRCCATQRTPCRTPHLSLLFPETCWPFQ